MSEEIIHAISSEEAPPSEQSAAAAVDGAQAAEPVPAEIPAWQKALEEAPAEELLKHPKFKGIMGSELENRRVSWQTANDARLERLEADRKAAATQAELVDLARNNPDGLADRFLSEAEQQNRQREIAALSSSTREQQARSIGQAFRALPEWSELTPADHEEFITALAGVPDDEAIATFNAMASSKIADVKARKQFTAWQANDAEKARAAIRLEEQAKLFQNGDRPGIERARGNGAINDEPNWRTEPAKWEKWYQAGVSAGRR